MQRLNEDSQQQAKEARVIIAQASPGPEPGLTNPGPAVEMPAEPRPPKTASGWDKFAQWISESPLGVFVGIVKTAWHNVMTFIREEPRMIDQLFTRPAHRAGQDDVDEHHLDGGPNAPDAPPIKPRRHWWF
jgi:hypothetical protein